MRHTISDHIIQELRDEYYKATVDFPSFRSAHEGYAILLEEMDELKAEVFRKTRLDYQLRKEALHVAVMAIRFITDLC